MQSLVAWLVINNGTEGVLIPTHLIARRSSFSFLSHLEISQRTICRNCSLVKRYDVTSIIKIALTIIYKILFMKLFLYQLCASMGTLTFAFWHLLSFPFSRRSRWRNSRLWNVACDPFVLERIPLSFFIPEPFDITLGPLKSEPHNASEYELLCLAALTKALHVENAFEIGTYDGRSARAMAMNLPVSGRLFTLNLPPGEDRNVDGVKNVDSLLNAKVKSGFRFAGTPESTRIEQLFGDSATFDFKSYEGRISMVFIDGSHHIGYVQNDTEAALRILRPSGGWIVWHDAQLYGVVPYLTQRMKRDGWDIRIIEGTTLAVGFAQDGKIATWPEFGAAEVEV